MKRKPKAPLPSPQYVRDLEWIGRHLDSLSRQHPNQWVAVHKGKVVSTGRNLGKVKAEAHRKHHTREIPVYFVDDGTIILGAGVLIVRPG